MRLQLDYDTKTIITLNNDIPLGEFVKKIKTILPDWKEWDLRTHTIINNWNNPYIITDYQPNITPWWDYTELRGDTGTANPASFNCCTQPTSGTYCLELK